MAYNTGGGSEPTELWQPGAPTLANWTPINIGSGSTEVNAIVTQNGTKSCSINFTGGSELYLGGWSLTAPTPPYKVLFGFNYATVWDSTGKLFDIAFGWTDGAGNYVYFDINSSSVYSNISNNPTPLSVGSLQIFSSATALNYFIIEDDGTNVSIGFSADGVNFVTYWTEVKSGGTLTNYDDIAFLVGCTSYPTPQSISGVAENINFFLFDPNAASRQPLAPGY